MGRGNTRRHLMRAALGFGLGAVLAGALALAGGPAAAESCAPDRVSLRGDFGVAQFTVELADDAEERSLGLMNRESMPASAGMLFVYEKPQVAAFWMRNTLIPLDMLFIDASGTITRIHDNARPLDETVIEGGAGVTHVLEINGGLAKALGVKPGDQIQHPTVAPDKAVWPCS